MFFSGVLIPLSLTLWSVDKSSVSPSIIFVVLYVSSEGVASVRS